MFQHSEQIDLITPALVQALGAMENAQKNTTNTFHQSRYADLTAVLAVVKPELAQHGLCVLQPLRMAEDGRFALQTILLHTSCQWIGSETLLEIHAEKGKSMAQCFGSAVSYYRRYQLQALTGIGAEDDDGSNAGQPANRQSQPQSQSPPRETAPPSNGQQPAHQPAQQQPADGSIIPFLAECHDLFQQLSAEEQSTLLAKYGQASSLETINPKLWHHVQSELMDRAATTR